MDGQQQEVVTRAALGRMASLGDLYDARTDNFCGVSIFNQAIPEGALQIQDVDYSSARLMTGDILSGKLSRLDVEPELAVSMLAGLFTPEGAGRYLMESVKSARTVSTSLLYNIETKDESLDLFEDQLKEAFSLDVIEKAGDGGATHVVIGITWGANAVISCQNENQENRDVKEVEGALSAQMNKLSLSIGGESPSVEEVKKEGDEVDEEKDIQFEVRTFSDILPRNEDPQPTTTTTKDGALQLVTQLPGLVKECNGGKGQPLSYRLIPLSVFQEYLDLPMNADDMTLEEASLSRIVKLFEELAEAQQEVHDLHQDATEHKYCVEVSDLGWISRLKDDMAYAETVLRSNLSRVLAEVRSGEKDSSELDRLVTDFQSLRRSPKNVKSLLDRWGGSLRLKMAFARHLLKNGVNYIGMGSSLDEELLKDFESLSYVLFFTQQSSSLDAQRWRGDCQLFLQEMKMTEDNRRCYVVDCDIHPGLLPKGMSSCIQVLQAGEVITEDLLRDQEKVGNSALVKLTSGTVSYIRKPKQSAPLTIPCTGLNCHPVPDYEWICKKCYEKIDYGFDDHIYCDCGKTPLAALEFRCTDPQHGLAFQRHAEDSLNEKMSKLKPFQELNILILGETGVGKSTWINGFMNFITYGTLEEAERGELCTLIPSKFTVCDANFEEILVTTGTDENEAQQSGQSATQEARVYQFRMGNMNIRLIDTPGIGDTRGIEQDKKNFQNILGTLSHFDEIHGICILLKPNNARLNVMFRFCIKELLTYLHRDASKNIIFCFTNSRGTFYRPGDTMPALKTLLNENQTVKIPVSPRTVYCFDSEAYRFLAAIKNNPPVEFPEDERENFSRSWQKSNSETLRMLEHIKELVPHPIQSTLNLNHARELVLKMVRPLAEISRNIQTNKAIVQDEKREIERTKESIKELKKKEMTTRTEIEVSRLDYPKTVCSNSTCVKIWSVENVKTTEYVTVCHDHCFLTDVKEDSIGDPGLMGCWAMNNGSCKHHYCGHHYREHLHIYYDSVQVVKKVEDQSVKESLRQNLSAAEMKQKMIAAKDDMIKEYEYELKEIERASVTFAYFLKINAITPYNDGMEMYLNHLIREENDKIALGGNGKVMVSLIRCKESYLFEKNVLEQQMKMGEGSPPKAEEVDRLVAKLKELKHSGKVLKDSLDCVNYASGMTYSEAVVKPRMKPPPPPRDINNMEKMEDVEQQTRTIFGWPFRWAKKYF